MPCKPSNADLWNGNVVCVGSQDEEQVYKEDLTLTQRNPKCLQAASNTILLPVWPKLTLKVTTCTIQSQPALVQWGCLAPAVSGTGKG